MTLGHTLGIVEADARIDRLVDTLPEVTSETLGNTLGDVEDKAHVKTVDALLEAEDEILRDTLVNKATESLLDRTADTTAEVESGTPGVTRSHV